MPLTWSAICTQMENDLAFTTTPSSKETGTQLLSRGQVRFPWVIVSLVTADIAIFALMRIVSAYKYGTNSLELAGKYPGEMLLQWGATYGPNTLGGQYWRIISGLFLHVNLIHLLFNMVFLLGVGRYLEDMLGGMKTLMIFLFAGVGGALTGIEWHPTKLIMGASAAVDGLAAAALLCCFVVGKPTVERRVFIALWTIGAMFLSLRAGLMSTDVINSAHVGGAITGLLIGSLIVFTSTLTDDNKRVHRLQNRVLVIIFLALSLAFVVLVTLRKDVVMFYEGQKLEESDPLAALDKLKYFVGHNPHDVAGHSELASIYADLKRNDEAIKEYQEVLKIKPNDPGVLYNLGRVYYQSNRQAEAVLLFFRSVPRLPDDSDRYYNFALSLKVVGAFAEAEPNARKAVRLNPKVRHTHLLLADILNSLGKTQEAAAERDLAARLKTD